MINVNDYDVVLKRIMSSIFARCKVTDNIILRRHPQLFWAPNRTVNVIPVRRATQYHYVLRVSSGQPDQGFNTMCDMLLPHALHVSPGQRDKGSS